MEHDSSFTSLYSTFDEEPKSRKDRLNVSFDMWGSCNPRNIGKKIRRTACLRPLYQELLRHFVSICERAGIEAFAYGGTALGVYREGGRMIAFDYDIDFATLEFPSPGDGALSRLANFCLQSDSGASVTNIEGLKNGSLDETVVQVDFSNAFSDAKWLYLNTDGEVCERPYTGQGSKKAKMFFTLRGLQEAARRSGQIKSRTVEEVAHDLYDIHIDLFTLSPHPQSPSQYLRINWDKGGVYDSLQKKFPLWHFFPLQKVEFEGVPVFAPANLEAYLTEEYCYLGRDAMYDTAKQCYIKIPPYIRDKLSLQYTKYASGAVMSETS